MTLLFDPNPDSAVVLADVLGAETRLVDNIASLRRALSDESDDLVVVGPDVELAQAAAFAAGERIDRPALGVVLVQRRIDSVVLSEAMRSGIREVVNAENLAELDAACRRSLDLSAQVRSRDGLEVRSRKQGQVVTVFAAKGGCGKSTLATNLAAALSVRGDVRICLLDLDLQFGDVAITMGLPPERTLADVVDLRNIDEEAVHGLVTRHSDRLDAVLAPVDPATAERIPAARVTDLITVLRGMYDVVVIDSPPAFSEHVLAAFDLTDHFALVTTLDIGAVKSLKVTLDTLDLLSYPEQGRHVVLNRADSKVGLTAADVEQTVGAKVEVRLPSTRAVPAATNRGVPLVLDDRRHALSSAVRAFADSLVQAPAPAAAAPAPVAASGAHAGPRRRISLLRKAEVAP